MPRRPCFISLLGDASETLDAPRRLADDLLREKPETLGDYFSSMAPIANSRSFLPTSLGISGVSRCCLASGIVRRLSELVPPALQYAPACSSSRRKSEDKSEDGTLKCILISAPGSRRPMMSLTWSTILLRGKPETEAASTNVFYVPASGEAEDLSLLCGSKDPL